MTPDRLDHLIQALFDGLLNDSDREEFNALLLASKEARDRYRRANAFHSTLLRRAAAVNADRRPSNPEIRRADLRSTRVGLRSTLLKAAAAIMILGAATTIFIHQTDRPGALLTAATGTTWGGEIQLATNQNLPISSPLELIRGVAELTYPSGAQVTIEGPCRFRLDKPEAITVLHGRASVHAPPGAQGFRVDTPGGRFVDLGTRFGLAVGTDGTNPVILTEVYEGEIEVQAVAGKPRLYRGDARALLQDTNGSRLLASSLDTDPVNVPKIISKSAETTQSGVNLALGKPVTSPGYCIRPHGSVFPPGNLTDGRTNDTGVPGDWSFWLAPDGENGEFTVDLGANHQVGRISLQNTANRRIDDRGTEAFQAFISTDGRHFTRMIDGKLPRIDTRAEGAFPFHDFTFPAVEARYVKIVVTAHFHHLSRPVTDPDQGGGLNEIRIFSK